MDTNIEVWKDISGYEGYYQVSTFGNVRSVDRDILRSDGTMLHVPYVTKSQTVSKGYHSVSLYKDNACRYFHVHRLVLQTFKPVNNMDCLQVNHIDGNRENNNISNLEWVTGSMNIQHGVSEGNVNKRSKEFYALMGKSHGQKVRNLVDGKVFNTMTDAAFYYGLTVSFVSDRCKDNKLVNGFQFRKEQCGAKGRVHNLVDPNRPNSHEPRPVKCLETGVIYPSRIQASKDLGISTSSIVDSLRDGRTHRGYTFVEP